MAPLSFDGSFARVPASIAIEDSLSTSSVSLTFLRINDVPQTVRIHEGANNVDSASLIFDSFVVSPPKKKAKTD